MIVGVLIAGLPMLAVAGVALKRTLHDRRTTRRAERMMLEVLRSRADTLGLRDQRGQVLAELALCLPVLAAIFLAIITGGETLSNRELVANAARSAAVAASQGADPQQAAEDAAPGVSGLTVDVSQSGSIFTACVTAPWSIEYVIGSQSGTLRACSSELQGGTS